MKCGPIIYYDVIDKKGTTFILPKQIRSEDLDLEHPDELYRYHFNSCFV